ncbi:MAG: SDR family NAD(P)-dependent oxidoreductase [Sphingomonadales bacterium]|nr:SDR family NAD(P)-dependent oxidoreductase [Sphingomonadales bacterium]
MIDFTGQVVIVTGAGRGIGRLFALDFASRGAAVVVNDLGGRTGGGGDDCSVAEAVAEEIRKAGGRAVASADSVASPEGGAAIVAAALERFGRLDAVVSNAGIVNYMPFEHMTRALWEQMLAVHLHGAFNVAQPAYRVMKEQGYGRFVFMSSSSGMLGQEHQSHYAAAKAGVFGLKNIIALERAHFGIKANCVLPWATTRMMTEGLADSPEILEMPLVKLMKPHLVPPLVTWLASRDCAVSHENFSAGAGGYSRIFVGTGPGYFTGADSHPTAEEVGAHFDAVMATEPFEVHGSAAEESASLCSRNGVDFIRPDARSLRRLSKT